MSQYIIGGIPIANEALAKFGVKDYKAKPGSMEGECNQCNAKVWVGPTQVEVLKTKPMQILCLTCIDAAAKQATPGNDFKVIALSKESGSFDIINPE